MACLCLGKKNWADLPRELFPDWSFIHMRYLYRVVPNYLHLSALIKQNSSVDLLELAVTRGFRLVQHSAVKVLTSFGRDETS